MSNSLVLFLLGVLPVAMLRPFWNLRVWNKIYKTKYTPMPLRIKAGEGNANFYCMLIFWWLKREDDSRQIKSFKKIGNWVSVISVLMFTLYLVFILLYGEDGSWFPSL